MLYANLLGREINLLSFNYTARQREIATFELVVVAADVIDLDPYLEDIKIFRDGLLLAEGIVRTPFPVALFGSGAVTPITIRLKCDEYIGLLQGEESADFHFQNQLLSISVGQLLGATAGSVWALGDTSTLNDIEITLDVRGPESLWTQIQDTAKTSQNITFLRYGGFSGGAHRLDIGYFRRSQNLVAQMGENILEPPILNEPSREPLKIIRPISGSTSDTPVNIDLALEIDGSLSSPTQDYQILPNTGLVINNRIAKGIRITKTYSAIKTENSEAPSPQEEREAALALYRRCVAEFIASEPYIAFKLVVALDRKPLIHDTIYVKSPVYERVLDDYTGQYEDILTYNIDGYFRIVGIQVDYVERKAVVDAITGDIINVEVYTLDVTSGDLEDETEIAEIIFNRLDTRTRFDTISSKVDSAPFRVNVQNSISTGLASNCSVGGVAGRTTTFATPTPPTGSTSATFGVTGVLPSTANYTITQAGGIATSAIVCVTGANNTNWTTLSSATIAGVWTFN